MSSYPFTIDGTAFYATEEPNWQPYGGIDAYSVLGRPLPSGQGSFTVTLLAVPYSGATLTGAGDPLESSGTYQELFRIARDAKNAAGGRSTFVTFDPASNTYNTVSGVIDFPALLAQMRPGLANTSVTIKVNAAFISDSVWSTYTGGDPTPTTPPPYIPGDDLPPPDPLKTYGWGYGRWNFGFWSRGEGV